MTVNALAAVHMLFSTIWRLFTSWTFPGTNVTPASWIIFAFVLVVAVRFVKRLGGGDSGESS